MTDMAVELTELEKLEVTRVDAVGRPANGFPVLIMKGITEPVAKASHPPFTGSHSHEHPAFGGPDGDGDGDHEHDHSHDGDADHHHSHAAKASGDGDGKVDCPTCGGDGKIMGGKRDCPDCDATGKVTPAKAKSLAAKSLARAILADLSASPRELLKAVGADGQVDEAPDVELGSKILAMLGQAIQAEAAEMAAGAAGEVCDIMELACAAEAVRCWRDGEQAVSLGDVMPASMLMQSAAKADTSAEGRRKSAAAGHSLPDGSYPIENEHDLKSAAILARSGHGDADAAKRLIARRAKELGVANPLDDSDDGTSKGAIAQEVTSVDTVVKGSDDLAKAVADAVTKATASLRDELSSVREELAKVKATPVPGGPKMSAAAAARRPADDGEDHAAKALYYDGWAERISDPVESDRYRQLAARERAKITTS